MMRSDFVFDLGQSRGAPRLIAGLRDHRKYRLPVEQDFLGREDRIIVFAGRAYVIAAGDVRRSEDVDDAKRGPDRVEIRREIRPWATVDNPSAACSVPVGSARSSVYSARPVTCLIANS